MGQGAGGFDLSFLPTQDCESEPKCTICLRPREWFTQFSSTKKQLMYLNSYALIEDIKTNVTCGHDVWGALRIQGRKCQNQHNNADVHESQDLHTNIWTGESRRIWHEFSSVYPFLTCPQEISVSTLARGNIFGQLISPCTYSFIHSRCSSIHFFMCTTCMRCLLWARLSVRHRDVTLFARSLCPCEWTVKDTYDRIEARLWLRFLPRSGTWLSGLGSAQQGFAVLCWVARMTGRGTERPWLLRSIRSGWGS